MNAEEILKQCKDEVAQNKGYKDYTDFIRNYRNSGEEYGLHDLANNASNLYAQKMAELFVVWKEVNRYNSYFLTSLELEFFVNESEYKWNGEENRKLTTSELYNLFIEQLNKEK